MNKPTIITKYGIFDNLKQQGLIRAFGMSSKTIAGGILTAKSADVVMVTLNLNHLEEIYKIIFLLFKKQNLITKKLLD